MTTDFKRLVLPEMPNCKHFMTTKGYYVAVYMAIDQNLAKLMIEHSFGDVIKARGRKNNYYLKASTIIEDFPNEDCINVCYNQLWKQLRQERYDFSITYKAEFGAMLADNKLKSYKL